MFDPPVDGELLCDEHVIAQDAEVHWRSFGLAAVRASVNERYRASAASCGFGLAFKPPLFDVTDGDRRLETFEVGERGYPTCSKGPSPAHRTVVVLSERHRH